MALAQYVVSRVGTAHLGIRAAHPTRYSFRQGKGCLEEVDMIVRSRNAAFGSGANSFYYLMLLIALGCCGCQKEPSTSHPEKGVASESNRDNADMSLSYRQAVADVRATVQKRGPFSLAYNFNPKAPGPFQARNRFIIALHEKGLLFLSESPETGADYAYLVGDHETKLIDNATGAVITMATGDESFFGTAYDSEGSITIRMYWILRAAAAISRVEAIVKDQSSIKLSADDEKQLAIVLYQQKAAFPEETWLFTETAKGHAFDRWSARWSDSVGPIFEFSTQPCEEAQVLARISSLSWVEGVVPLRRPPITDLVSFLANRGIPSIKSAPGFLRTPSGFERINNDDRRIDQVQHLGPFSVNGTIVNLFFAGPEPYDGPNSGMSSNWYLRQERRGVRYLSYVTEPGVFHGACLQPAGQDWALTFTMGDADDALNQSLTDGLSAFLHEYVSAGRVRATIGE